MFRNSASAGAALILLATPVLAQTTAVPALPAAGPTMEMLANVTDWTSLFDGKSLAGWVGQGYEVKDGAITCTPMGTFLRTEKEYADFVLELEFQLQPGSNNGIGVRYPGKGDAAYEGMEIQVLDDAHPKYHNEKFQLADWQYTGSVYGIAPSIQSKKNLLKPVGEWNKQTLLVIGDHVKVILNGETINDAYLANLKPIHQKEHPGQKRTTGYITFCGHGDFVAYKNIRVKDFSPPPPLPGTPPNTPPAGFTALFNGKDLSGWKGLPAAPNDNPFKRAALSPEARAEVQAKADEVMKAHWKIEDGALVFDGKGASLATAKPYGDFDFYVEWKIPATADSGIYLRGTPQIQIWDPSNPAQFKHGNQKGSGGMWNNKGPGKEPLVLADQPLGEWNTFLIRMVGETVSIHLNGKLIIDKAPLENYWAPGKPLPRSESIELQNHGNNLWFRSLYVRELPY